MLDDALVELVRARRKPKPVCSLTNQKNERVGIDDVYDDELILEAYIIAPKTPSEVIWREEISDRKDTPYQRIIQTRRLIQLMCFRICNLRPLTTES